MTTDLTEDGLSIHQVEGILQIDLQNAFLPPRNVFVGDEGGEGVDDGLAAVSNANCQLKRSEKIGSVRRNLRRGDLGTKTPKRLSNCDGSETSVFLCCRE